MLDLTRAETGDPGNFLQNRFGDQYLYAVNRNSFNETGSETIYRSRFGEQLFDEDYLYLVAGSDSGQLIEYVLEHGTPEGSRYVFVELPEVIEKLYQRFSPDRFGNRVTLCDPENSRQHIYGQNFSVYAHLDQIRVINSLAVEDGFMPGYRDLLRVLNEWVIQERWKFRAGFYSPGFIRHQLANVAENDMRASLLAGHFSGRTAAILAGGPSLDASLEWVQENRDRLCVIAVSRICRQLLPLGIRPDIICSVDPYPISFDVSREMLHFWEDTVFAKANHVTPLLSAQWKGTSIYLDDCLPWSSEIDRDENIPGRGPTVTNSAISLAIHMGFDQAVLCGVDLCFSAEGFSHASGSNERGAGPLVGYVGHPVETYSGGEAETNSPFRNAIKELHKQAKEAGQLECRLINPSPAAARVDGIDHLPFDQIPLQPAEVSARDLMGSLLPENNSSHRIQHMQNALQEVRKARHKAGRVLSISRSALGHVDSLFAGGDKKDFRHKLKMDRLEKQLNREFENFGRLCKLFGMREFVRSIRPDEEADWTDQQIEEAAREYYQAYIVGATRLIENLDTAVTRLESRLAEEQAGATVPWRQWLTDDTPGRSEVWLDRYGSRLRNLSDEDRKALWLLRRAFRRRMQKMRTSHVARCSDDARLQGAECKALECFRNYDREGLTRLVNGLELRDEEEARILLGLARGLLAELNHDKSSAIAAYQEVDQLPYMELALTRLAGIALDEDNFDYALQAMEMLSVISVNYMPHYANLLRLHGDVQRALDVYTAYLPQVPDDLATMTRLGLLYRELGVSEGAEWVFRHILDDDPHNTVALNQLHELEAIE